MNQLDAVANWLNSVAYSHSQSEATEEQYKRVWERFSGYIGKTAEQIIAEYDSSDDRIFRRKYAQYIRFWIAELAKEDLAMKKIMAKIQPLVDFVNSFDTPEHLKKTLYLITEEPRDERFRPLKTIEETAREEYEDRSRTRKQYPSKADEGVFPRVFLFLTD
jgi:transposase-like protein